MKKSLLEKIHDLRYLIIIVIIFLDLIGVWFCFKTNHKFIGAFGIIALGLFIKQSFRAKFSTKHNFALVCWGDTVLERMFQPGNWLVLLPGYEIIEHKDSFLLSTLELSLEIKEKECQFKAGKGVYLKKPFDNSGKDSVSAKNSRLNYYIDKDVSSLYRFVTKAPADWNSSIEDNLSGDLAQSFQNRIYILEQAQGYKDFKYEDGKKSFFWQIDPKDRIEFEEIERVSLVSIQLSSGGPMKQILALEEITELQTSIERMERYGIHPVNLTIGDYVDSQKTDEFRNSIRLQDFENEKNRKKTDNNLKRINKAKAAFVKGGLGEDEAMREALAQISREDESRFDYGGDAQKSLMIGAEGKAKAKKS